MRQVHRSHGVPKFKKARSASSTSRRRIGVLVLRAQVHQQLAQYVQALSCQTAAPVVIIRGAFDDFLITSAEEKLNESRIIRKFVMQCGPHYFDFYVIPIGPQW